MKRAEISALEKSLASLPVDLKKYLANQLLGQINAQAHALLETATSHRLSPHCNGEQFVKWGPFCGPAALQVPEFGLSQNL